MVGGHGREKTSETMCQMLRIRFRINITGSGMRRALGRYRISYKKLTQMYKRAFTPAVRELTRVFLLRRLGLDKRDGVWVDEFLYKPENVGSKYGYASSYLRAIQVDDGRGSGDGVMFIAAMTDTEVLPVTLPVVQPATVTGWLFEMWFIVFLLPAMLVRGKRFVAMDNARVHRKRVLRALFWAVGIFVIFIPPYSPWFMPIEKMFLSTHMAVTVGFVTFVPTSFRVSSRCSTGTPLTSAPAAFDTRVGYDLFVRFIRCSGVRWYYVYTRSQESPSGAARERRQAFPGTRTNFRLRTKLI